MRIPEEGRPGLVRSYSPSSAPGAAEYRISAKCEDHGKVSIYYTAPDLEIAGEPGITHGRMTSDGIRELGIPADAHIRAPAGGAEQFEHPHRSLRGAAPGGSRLG
ncbi:hypothetical protein ACFWD7_08100 [Streptomyces mirabilis]|uniref:hypothetical protein n=1 Tax=Streptomyces mirabilis TaxID=68239 RepID=UPI0036BE1C8B